MRVLNVLRHWVSKHAQDFESDQRLKNLTIEFLEDITYSPNLLPAEHKAVNQLLRLITKEDPESSKVNLDVLLAPPLVSVMKLWEERFDLNIVLIGWFSFIVDSKQGKYRNFICFGNS